MLEVESRDTIKKLVTRPHTINIGYQSITVGIQVGWSGGDLTNEPYTIWWGSTKDESTLQSLIEDLRVNHGEVFVVDELADRQLELE